MEFCAKPKYLILRYCAVCTEVGRVRLYASDENPVTYQDAAYELILYDEDRPFNVISRIYKETRK